MFQADRHEALAATPWDAMVARAAIDEIAASALSHFDPETLWPAHPSDSVPAGMANVYMGATGVILALDHLKRVGAIGHSFDFAPAMPALVERDNVWLMNIEQLASLNAHGSLLFGDLGAHLVAMRVSPDSQTADRIYARSKDNDSLPPLELMWGTAGSMFVCLFMHALTAESRFKELYLNQGARLISGLEDAGSYRLWTQEMYGMRARFLGLVHGFAGNMFALIRGWDWLDAEQQDMIATVAMETLPRTAKRSDAGANWPNDANQPDAPLLCQICHGAPGIVTAFAGAPFSSPEFERLLLEGGDLIWSAGPLKKGSNFCHGTGGNAYAMLTLYKRTGDAIWLERARAFAMTAIAQMRAAFQELGRGRYTLWTGDPGLAVCLWSCITGEPQFPGLDAI